MAFLAVVGLGTVCTSSPVTGGQWPLCSAISVRGCTFLCDQAIGRAALPRLPSPASKGGEGVLERLADRPGPCANFGRVLQLALDKSQAEVGLCPLGQSLDVLGAKNRSSRRVSI